MHASLTDGSLRRMRSIASDLYHDDGNALKNAMFCVNQRLAGRADNTKPGTVEEKMSGRPILDVTAIRAVMKKFETMINTCDDALGDELIDPDAAFFTPASEKPLRGPQGYLSIVRFMRQSFSDVQWKIQDMAAENNVAAVHWVCTGTHDGVFLGRAPTGRRFSASIMNFYYFNEQGKIVNDIAAEGMIAILRQLGMIEL